jgi:hypothetical protein
MCPAGLTDAIEAYFNPFNQPQEIAFKRFHVQVDTLRVQAFHHATFVAEEVGMGEMIDTWSKAITK